MAGGKAPAEEYGNWLKNEFGLKEVTVYFPKISDSDFTRAVWLCRLDGNCRSGFDCDGGLLDGGYLSVFRVSAEGARNTAVGSSQKTNDPKVHILTPAQIERIAKPYISRHSLPEFRKELENFQQRK